MTTFFIADIHLCAQEPAITAGFLRFLREDAPQADALYILGDLFEAWIGDDDPQPLHAEIAAALNHLHQQACPASLFTVTAIFCSAGALRATA